MSTTTISIKLGDRKEALIALAERKGCSLHNLLLEALDNYIEHEKARLDYEAQAVRSYERFQATGEHITLNEWVTSKDDAAWRDL